MAISLGGDDCDDAEPGIHPRAIEACGDGRDQNCDGHDSACFEGGERSLADADAKWLGKQAIDSAGESIAPLGDMDADGLDDLLIGSAGQGPSSVTNLAYGGRVGAFDLLEAEAKLIGTVSSFASAGDVDADGFDDLIFGAPQEASDAGTVYLVRGPVSGTLDLLRADAIFHGTKPDERAGASVSSAGDLDGDGLPDLAIGAPGDSSRRLSAGAVYLIAAASLSPER